MCERRKCNFIRVAGYVCILPSTSYSSNKELNISIFLI